MDNAAKIHYGCPDMFEAVCIIRPKYHLFGHIHDAYGIETSEHTAFVNATLMDENYRLKNMSFVFDI